MTSLRLTCDVIARDKDVEFRQKEASFEFLQVQTTRELTSSGRPPGKTSSRQKRGTEASGCKPGTERHGMNSFVTLGSQILLRRHSTPPPGHFATRRSMSYSNSPQKR